MEHQGSSAAGTPGWVWAALTVHAVNTLTVDEPCCPHECAPCGALQALHDDGGLENTLAPYVKITGTDWDWWNPDPASGPDILGIGRLGSFRWEWVTARWCDPHTCERARFYEEDEQVDDVSAAFERGEKGITGLPQA